MLLELLNPLVLVSQITGQRFDVEKALQAKPLKDFEEAISMVSYGFNTLEEFHLSSSSRDVVANVKIPLLFIQDNATPFSSIPRLEVVNEGDVDPVDAKTEQVVHATRVMMNMLDVTMPETLSE
ncbi:hypothetical protein Tco_0731332 [Tanacetum coccineum]